MTKPKFIYTTYIKTTPKKLWAAITNPEFTRQYWGGLANVSDWKKGSPWQHVTKDEPEDFWKLAYAFLGHRPPPSWCRVCQFAVSQSRGSVQKVTFMHHLATPDYVEPADSSSGLCVRSWQQAEDREPTVSTDFAVNGADTSSFSGSTTSKGLTTCSCDPSGVA